MKNSYTLQSAWETSKNLNRIAINCAKLHQGTLKSNAQNLVKSC